MKAKINIDDALVLTWMVLVILMIWMMYDFNSMMSEFKLMKEQLDFIQARLDFGRPEDMNVPGKHQEEGVCPVVVPLTQLKIESLSPAYMLIYGDCRIICPSDDPLRNALPFNDVKGLTSPDFNPFTGMQYFSFKYRGCEVYHPLRDILSRCPLDSVGDYCRRLMGRIHDELKTREELFSRNIII